LSNQKQELTGGFTKFLKKDQPQKKNAYGGHIF
jgi:hypothetical protein